MSWIISNLSSDSHHVCMDVNILLDALGSSRLFDKNFIDEKYHAQKGKFKNETTARVAASFGRELLTVFGKVDSSVVVDNSSSPLPAIKTYSSFNAPESHLGIKQRILGWIQNIFTSIIGDISSRLTGLLK